MNRDCRRAYFSGSVQGVGFRYTTHRLALGFDVAGFVRNLPDGRVELVIEGNPDEIHRFLGAVQDAMEPVIRGVDVQSCPAPDLPFDGFSIR